MMDFEKAETKKIRELRSIYSNLDSPDLGVMYSSAGKLMMHETAKSLLPKTMALLDTNDATLRRLVFRTAGRNAYGKYISELFESMKNLNSAEREQVLQGIEESFSMIGPPVSKSEKKNWIEALKKLGREHQPTVFGLMILLGDPGIRWVRKRIRNHIETIQYGTIPKMLVMPRKKHSGIVKLLVQKSVKKKPELLPYICGIVDKKSVKHLSTYLVKGDWQDRAEVAATLGKIGITSASGLVMEIVADPDWRVKQALLENINIEESRFTSILKILGYMITDSHSRVRGQAERIMLQLGSIECHKSTLEKQRKRIEKKYRRQLLRAAGKNQDVDASWLGVEIIEDPIPYIEDGDLEEDDGVSLADLHRKDGEKEEPKEKVDLMAALLQARKDASDGKRESKEKSIPLEIDMDAVDSSSPTTDRFLLILKKLSQNNTVEVTMDDLKEHGPEVELSAEEVVEALEELEKEGIVYRSSKGTVKRVDIDF